MPKNRCKRKVFRPFSKREIRRPSDATTHHFLYARTRPERGSDQSKPCQNLSGRIEEENPGPFEIIEQSDFDLAANGNIAAQKKIIGALERGAGISLNSQNSGTLSWMMQSLAFVIEHILCKNQPVFRAINPIDSHCSRVRFAFELYKIFETEIENRSIYLNKNSAAGLVFFAWQAEQLPDAARFRSVIERKYNEAINLGAQTVASFLQRNQDIQAEKNGHKSCKERLIQTKNGDVDRVDASIEEDGIKGDWRASVRKGNTINHSKSQVYTNQEAHQTTAHALESEKRAAIDGDKHAQYRLAMRFVSGDQVEQNTEAAINWLTKSANEELAEAQFELILLLDSDGKFKEAFRWAQRALLNVVGKNRERILALLLEERYLNLQIERTKSEAFESEIQKAKLTRRMASELENACISEMEYNLWRNTLDFDLSDLFDIKKRGMSQSQVLEVAKIRQFLNENKGASAEGFSTRDALDWVKPFNKTFEQLKDTVSKELFLRAVLLCESNKNLELEFNLLKPSFDQQKAWCRAVEVGCDPSLALNLVTTYRASSSDAFQWLYTQKYALEDMAIWAQHGFSVAQALLVKEFGYCLADVRMIEKVGWNPCKVRIPRDSNFWHLSDELLKAIRDAGINFQLFHDWQQKGFSVENMLFSIRNNISIEDSQWILKSESSFERPGLKEWLVSTKGRFAQLPTICSISEIQAFIANRIEPSTIYQAVKDGLSYETFLQWQTICTDFEIRRRIIMAGKDFFKTREMLNSGMSIFDVLRLVESSKQTPSRNSGKIQLPSYSNPSNTHPGKNIRDFNRVAPQNQPKRQVLQHQHYFSLSREELRICQTCQLNKATLHWIRATFPAFQNEVSHELLKNYSAILNEISGSKRSFGEVLRLLKKGIKSEVIRRFVQTSLSEEEFQQWNSVCTNLKEIDAWRKGGFSPDESKNWKSNGFQISDAHAWRHVGVDSTDAVLLRRYNISQKAARNTINTLGLDLSKLIRIVRSWNQTDLSSSDWQICLNNEKDDGQPRYTYIIRVAEICALVATGDSGGMNSLGAAFRDGPLRTNIRLSDFWYSRAKVRESTESTSKNLEKRPAIAVSTEVTSHSEPAIISIQPQPTSIVKTESPLAPSNSISVELAMEVLKWFERKQLHFDSAHLSMKLDLKSFVRSNGYTSEETRRGAEQCIRFAERSGFTREVQKKAS